jgi:hypothetical protein
MEKFGSPIGKNYAKIDLAGRKALEKAEVNKFEGFGENLKNRFISALQFTPESEKEVEKRIIDEVEQIGKELEINFILAGKDFPLHGTIEEGVYAGKDNTEREEIFEEIKKAKELKLFEESILRESISYKYLLVDKGNIILTAVEIPEIITNMREALANFYANHNLKPIVLRDFLHITIGRMVEFSEEEKTEKFKEYKQRMIKLRHAISSDPLNLSVSCLFGGSTYDFLRNMEK